MGNLKFYMTPGSCSTGIHILLEEAGLVFEAHLINLMAGDQYKREYLEINPRGSVPALVRPDGVALADFQSIAWWVAETYPRRKLLPPTEAALRHVRQVMDYAIAVVHGEGFTRVFVSDNYASDASEKKGVEGEGLKIVERGFARLQSMFRGPVFVLDAFSIADAALFYIEFWADHLGLSLPSRCQEHFLAMLARPAVRQVLAEEGYANTLREHTGSASVFTEG